MSPQSSVTSSPPGAGTDPELLGHSRKREKRINPFPFLPLPLPTAAGRAVFSLCAILVLITVFIVQLRDGFSVLSSRNPEVAELGIRKKIPAKLCCNSSPGARIILVPRSGLCFISAGVDSGQPRSCVDMKEKV